MANKYFVDKLTSRLQKARSELLITLFLIQMGLQSTEKRKFSALENRNISNNNRKKKIKINEMLFLT